MKKRYSRSLMAGGALLALLGISRLFGAEDDLPYEFIIAEPGDVHQIVSVTGAVKPVFSVELSFEQSGTVSGVHANVGKKVTSGQQIVTLERSEFEAAVLQAEADLAQEIAILYQQKAAVQVQEAKLAELQTGLRAEELSLAETVVKNAEKALKDAEQNLRNIEEKAALDISQLYEKVDTIFIDAYADAYDAVTRYTEEIFTDDSTSPKINFQVLESGAANIAQDERGLANISLQRLKELNTTTLPSTDHPTLNEYIAEFSAKLDSVKNLFDALDSALNSATLFLSQATLVTHKSNVNSGRAALLSGITTLANHDRSIASQKVTNQNAIAAAKASETASQNAVLSAQAELNFKKASTRPEQIAGQEAQTAQARAAVSAQEARIDRARALLTKSRAQLAKRSLHAPFAGVITRQNAKVGEQAASGVSLVGLMSDAAFHVEAPVSESDIPKVKLEDAAEITLDAYGDDEIFDATVVAVDPAETLVDGVVTYKVTLEFVEKDVRIRSGMTANIVKVAAIRITLLR